MSAPLYNRDILALAVALADFPRLSNSERSGELRAPLCGSRMILDLTLDASNRVTAVGITAEACALGQAAATLLARHIVGHDGNSLATVHAAMTAWLGGQSDDMPDWPRIEELAPARLYPARHAAILLPFALAAQLSSDGAQEAAA